MVNAGPKQETKRQAWTEPKLEVLEVSETAGAAAGAGADAKGGFLS